MYVKPCIKEILRIGGQQGRYGFLRLDMNENPGGLPEDFVEAVKKELTPEYLAMYPEESRTKRLLAEYLSGTLADGGMGTSAHPGEGAVCPPEVSVAERNLCPLTVSVAETNLCLTNGSDMAIRYLYEIFAEPGSAVVTVAPSFEMYRIYSQIFGLRHRSVALGEDFTIPVEKILDAIQDDTDIVVLLNPNNPVGRACTEAEFEAVADRAAKVGALVIVDEAYHYFYRNTFLRQALLKDHVVILRTFSKLMSLAGCRMGYMAANPQIIEYVNHVRPSFEVNTVALKFAEKLLERPEIIDRLQEEADQGKAYLCGGLKEHGYEPMVQEGNFIFVKPKHVTAQEAAGRLETEERVLVKTYGSPLLKPYLRISTGAKPYMEAFLQAFFRVDVPGRED